MAEAVGLVLSGIALTSMLTTCMDILEYSSNARYWIHDLNVAVTKFELLQDRLTRLREISAHGPASARSESDSVSVSEKASFTVQTCSPATRGISGVKILLEQTNKLCRRYSLASMNEASEPMVYETELQASKSGLGSYGPQVNAQSRRANGSALKRWHRLGRQMSWVLQDKKKFDRLILDLDFLLSNTERLVECSPSHFPQTRYSQHTEGKNPSTSTYLTRIQNTDRSREVTDIDMASSNRSAKMASKPTTTKHKQRGNSRSAFYLQSERESPRIRAERAMVLYDRPPSPDSDSSGGTMPYQQVSPVAAQDDFQNNKMDDGSLLLAGVADEVVSPRLMRVVGTDLKKGSIMSIRGSNAVDLGSILNYMSNSQSMRLEELKLRQHHHACHGQKLPTTPEEAAAAATAATTNAVKK